jgi:hypothetical protein
MALVEEYSRGFCPAGPLLGLFHKGPSPTPSPSPSPSHFYSLTRSCVRAGDMNPCRGMRTSSSATRAQRQHYIYIYIYIYIIPDHARANASLASTYEESPDRTAGSAAGELVNWSAPYIGASRVRSASSQVCVRRVVHDFARAALVRACTRACDSLGTHWRKGRGA